MQAAYKKSLSTATTVTLIFDGFLFAMDTNEVYASYLNCPAGFDRMNQISPAITHNSFGISRTALN